MVENAQEDGSASMYGLRGIESELHLALFSVAQVPCKHTGRFTKLQHLCSGVISTLQQDVVHFPELCIL